MMRYRRTDKALAVNMDPELEEAAFNLYTLVRIAVAFNNGIGPCTWGHLPGCK
jgi:hypothetical protein